MTSNKEQNLDIEEQSKFGGTQINASGDVIYKIDYGSEKKKTILSLLNEYTEKVLEVSKKIENIQWLSIIFNVLSIFIFCISIISFVFFGFGLHISPIFYNGIIWLTLLAIITFNFLLQSAYSRRIQSLKRKASSISFRLEKLIQLSSQLEDHFLTDPIERIELDFQIADAESAFLAYKTLIKEKR